MKTVPGFLCLCFPKKSRGCLSSRINFKMQILGPFPRPTLAPSPGAPGLPLYKTHHLRFWIAHGKAYLLMGSRWDDFWGDSTHFMLKPGLALLCVWVLRVLRSDSISGGDGEMAPSPCRCPLSPVPHAYDGCTFCCSFLPLCKFYASTAYFLVIWHLQWLWELFKKIQSEFWYACFLAHLKTPNNYS